MSNFPDPDNSTVSTVAGNYDATKDPRTGRPPDPLEAQRIAREHRESQRQEQVSLITDADDSQEIESQRPGRMTSPEPDHGEKEAIEALVQEGVTRERAEELVRTHGVNWETLKAAAFAQDNFEAN